MTDYIQIGLIIGGCWAAGFAVGYGLTVFKRGIDTAI